MSNEKITIFFQGVLVGTIIATVSALLARQPSVTYEDLVKYGHATWKTQKGTGKPLFHLYTIESGKVEQ